MSQVGDPIQDVKKSGSIAVEALPDLFSASNPNQFMRERLSLSKTRLRF